MISNRRRLLTAAAAAVFSTQTVRAAETVIGTILEEVSRDQLQRFADEYRNDWKRDRDGTYEYRGRRYNESEWEVYWRKRYREEKRKDRRDREDEVRRRDEEVRRRDALQRLKDAAQR
ncbi:hypothetical protein [Sutterella megalosphaeroides]|uniref:Uncharacterized protein n=1 Tax=Sutterella megalosphaeroides TaxID=2494234 RepID=A0A2Z6IBG4_9BURK|nr:hypothetical protein [Sutterella megalosphaeroides]BBF23754.1 hypothetical protein SUTMEG_16450 [Sutterella megalosphaeroides]